MGLNTLLFIPKIKHDFNHDLNSYFTHRENLEKSNKLLFLTIPILSVIYSFLNLFSHQSQCSNKLWGGRFTNTTDPVLEKLNSSIAFDKRMYAEDILGSQAYAKSLRQAGLLSGEEADKICYGLEKIREEWEEGNFDIKDGDEDIHTANERRLKVCCWQWLRSILSSKRGMLCFTV